MKVTFKDEEYVINLRENLKVGDFIETLLEKTKHIIYELDNIILYDDKTEIYLHEQDMNELLLDYEKYNVIMLERERDESGHLTNKDIILINKYVKYAHEKEDNLFAQRFASHSLSPSPSITPPITFSTSTIIEGITNSNLDNRLLNSSEFYQLLLLMNIPVQINNHEENNVNTDENTLEMSYENFVFFGQFLIFLRGRMRDMYQHYNNENLEDNLITINTINSNISIIYDHPNNLQFNSRRELLEFARHYIANILVRSEDEELNLNNFIGEDIKIVLSNEELDKLKTTTYKKYIKTKYYDRHQFKSTTCNICLEEYENDNEIIVLKKCRHYFHKDCLTQWLKECSNKCPICRKVVSRGIRNDLRNYHESL